MKPLLLLTFTLILVAPVALAELRLEVDQSERELMAILDGDVVKRYEVSVGKPNHPTPRGTFKIRKVIWNPAWKPPDEKWARGKTAKPPGHPDNPMKRVKMFFKEPDYYIHGSDDLEGESHGCVRMDPDDVTELGQLIMSHGGKPMPEPWYRRIFRRRTTKVIYLTEPVAVSIR